MSFDIRKKKKNEGQSRGKRKIIQESTFTDCSGRNIVTAPETYALGTLGCCHKMLTAKCH